MLPDYRPIEHTSSEVESCSRFLADVFNNKMKFSVSYLKWLYQENPLGPALGWNAFDHSTVVGHYALVPVAAWNCGKVRKGLLSVNTAVAPTARLHGVFAAMAEKTYEDAAAAGFEFVLGVANAQSAPGFVRRLGFQDVGSLEPQIFFGNPSILGAAAGDDVGDDIVDKLVDNMGDAADPDAFTPEWNSERMLWRLRNPTRSYRLLESKSHTYIFGETEFPGFKSCLSRRADVLSVLGDSALRNSFVSEGQRATGWLFRPLTIWTGLGHCHRQRESVHLTLPTSLRPSPLRLIYRDLISPTRRLDPGKILFEPLDFDVF